MMFARVIVTSDAERLLDEMMRYDEVENCEAYISILNIFEAVAAYLEPVLLL
jgi:hypothetical protein